jgi:hypothetical protein
VLPKFISPLILGASSTGAIAGGVAAGAALVFAVPAIAFAMWRRRKPEEHFFDVPGLYHMVDFVFCQSILPAFSSASPFFLQLRRIQKFILVSSKSFHCGSFKLQLIISAIRTF